MHELAVTRNIVDIVVENALAQHAQRVIRVNLIVGEMRNFERNWVQRYYDQYAKDTIGAGAVVEIEYVPITFYCHDCGATFQFPLGHNERMHCVECGSQRYNMITGGELLIKEIEVA